MFEVRKTDPLFDVKCTFYRRDLAIPHRRVRVCVSDNESTKTMLALLRVIEADRYVDKSKNVTIEHKHALIVIHVSLALHSSPSYFLCSYIFADFFCAHKQGRF